LDLILVDSQSEDENMCGTTRRLLKWLVAGLLGVAVPLGPAAADTIEAVKLRVPVKLKKMLPEADRVSMSCRIVGEDADGPPLGYEVSEPKNIVNGHFDQVFEVVLRPIGTNTFTAAKSYKCVLLVHSGSIVSKPEKGTPPNESLWSLAKPDEFFRNEVTGPLDGGKFVGGIVGPEDVTVEPKDED
jgi:hypothetical protein